MWNTVRAQNYQTKNDIFIVCVLIFGTVMAFFGLLFNDTDIHQLTGSMSLLILREELLLILVVITLLLSTRISGWDMEDKTINYEVLSGHNRGEVYFGRVIASMFWCITCGMLVTLLPILTMSMINGWGVNMKLGDILIRYVLLIFPLFRLVSEFVLLTFILRSCYKAMLIGWVLFASTLIGCMVYEELTDRIITTQFAYSNLIWIMGFNNAKLEYINGEDVPVYITTVSSSMALGTILVCLLAGIACLGLGYVIFRKQDMN